MCYYTKTCIDPMTNSMLGPPEPVNLSPREEADLRLLAHYEQPDQIVMELSHAIIIYDRDPLQSTPTSGIVLPATQPNPNRSKSCQR